MNWHEEQRKISMARTRIAKTILAALLFLLLFVEAHAQTDPLPSWNDGAPKKAIVEFVKVTTEKGSAKFVAPEARIAVFGQDGTTWVEQPMYTQVIYCLERVPAVVKAKPGRKPTTSVLAWAQLPRTRWLRSWQNLRAARSSTRKPQKR